MDNFKLAYRKDIEGLRAIAIILVIVSHTSFNFLEGGFIGVDIFFVISGYLITSLILNEAQNTGAINFIDFYIRRLKRLLPALLFMLILTSFAAMLIISPFEQKQHLESAGYAALWLSNFYFIFSNLNYFEQSINLNLFLHTWSLGVEEQFYLIWPPLILFFLGLFKWQGHQQNFKRLLFCFYTLAVICLVFSIFLSFIDVSLGFYLMPSRIWQFTLGALTLLVLKNNRTNQKYNLLDVSGWIGILLIATSAIFLNSEMTYPGFLAIFPSIGTALILSSGAQKNHSGLLVRCISIKPLQYLGKISYSWYLWHWPFLVLGSYYFFTITAIQETMLVICSLLMAIISYILIESPIRKYVIHKDLPTSMFLVSFISLMIGAYSLSAWQLNNLANWKTNHSDDLYQQIKADIPSFYSLDCDDWYRSSKLKPCVFGDTDAENIAVLMGDSIGVQWFPALKDYYTKNNWKLIVLTKSSCPIIDEPIFYSRIGKEFKNCSRWRDSAIEWLRQSKVDTLFFGSSNVELTKDQWINGTKRILTKLTSKIINIYIINPTPRLPFDGPSCLTRQNWQPEWIRNKPSCTAVIKDAMNIHTYNWLREATNDINNASVINMNPTICPGDICKAIEKNIAIYRDNDHLTASYVYSISDLFFKNIQLSTTSHLQNPEIK